MVIGLEWKMFDASFRFLTEFPATALHLRLIGPLVTKAVKLSSKPIESAQTVAAEMIHHALWSA